MNLHSASDAPPFVTRDSESPVRGLNVAVPGKMARVENSVRNFSVAVRGWANRVIEYERKASERSDEWAEAHLFPIAAAVVGIGIILGALLALP
jgi:hypothetical protein